MKGLLIALMLVATPALAEEWYETPNQAGGRILLFKDKCPDGDGKVVFTTSPDGTSSQGCWYNRAEAVVIVWASGEVSSFDQTQFTYRTRKSEGKKK